MLPILVSHRPQGVNEEKKDPAIVVTAHSMSKCHIIVHLHLLKRSTMN